MNKLKWYSGGQERGNQAITIIKELLNVLEENKKNDELKKILDKYIDELHKNQSSIPFILSRMNIDISNTIRKNEISLSNNQSDILKKLFALSNIRYGYL